VSGGVPCGTGKAHEAFATDIGITQAPVETAVFKAAGVTAVAVKAAVVVGAGGTTPVTEAAGTAARAAEFVETAFGSGRGRGVFLRGKGVACYQ
jgi:hypothetical protein